MYLYALCVNYSVGQSRYLALRNEHFAFTSSSELMSRVSHAVIIEQMLIRENNNDYYLFTYLRMGSQKKCHPIFTMDLSCSKMVEEHFCIFFSGSLTTKYPLICLE